nr:BamA/TamA family outer membrane protein [Palleronia pontilimi]
MDITAQLATQRPRRIGFGAELSSVDGTTLSAYWLHRNLLGGAERFRVDGEVAGLGGATGGIDYSLRARFQRPATFSPNNTFFIDTELSHLEEPDFTSDTAALGFGIERRVNDQITISYGLAYRYSNVRDDAGERNYSLLTAPLSATYDTREQPLDAKRGFYVDVTATPFLGLNEESGDGGRLTFDARSYLSFGAEDRFTVAARVQGGSIVGADLRDVPNDYRFYSGGGGTVRGQEYQALDIELDGVESGGASFLGLQAELRAGLTDSIGVVAFADFGIVGRDSFPGSDSDSHSGAGLGLRYLTPIGPIRLDVATPISGPGNPSGYEIYVGIGQAF